MESQPSDHHYKTFVEEKIQVRQKKDQKSEEGNE